MSDPLIRELDTSIDEFGVELGLQQELRKTCCSTEKWQEDDLKQSRLVENSCCDAETLLKRQMSASRLFMLSDGAQPATSDGLQILYNLRAVAIKGDRANIKALQDIMLSLEALQESEPTEKFIDRTVRGGTPRWRREFRLPQLIGSGKEITMGERSSRGANFRQFATDNYSFGLDKLFESQSDSQPISVLGRGTVLSHLLPHSEVSAGGFYYSSSPSGVEPGQGSPFTGGRFVIVPKLDPSDGFNAPIFSEDPPLPSLWLNYQLSPFRPQVRRLLRNSLDVIVDGPLETQMLTEEVSVNFLTDLIAHAPGMNSTRADLLGVIEAESKTKPQRGEIDEAARKLIEKSRQGGWETVTLGETNNAVQVHVNGAGHFAWARTVSEGLDEQVLCNGQNLWHLYEEIGLGAKREYSRFHRRLISNIAPWLVAPVKELTIGADVVAVDERTVAIVPLGQKPLSRRCWPRVSEPIAVSNESAAAAHRRLNR